MRERIALPKTSLVSNITKDFAFNKEISFGRMENGRNPTNPVRSKTISMEEINEKLLIHHNEKLPIHHVKGFCKVHFDDVSR